MNYFVYDIQTDIKSLNDRICVAQSIGDAPGDCTKAYTGGILMANGQLAVIADNITIIYVTDRQSQVLTDNDFPLPSPFISA